MRSARIARIARIATTALVLSLALTTPVAAKVRYLQNRTETTVPKLLYPWTQASACSCCVCWETTLGTIFAYWDDNKLAGTGPWERLFYGGNGDSAFHFEIATGKIYSLSGLTCGNGSYPATLFSASKSKSAATAFTNTYLGYTFSYDDDLWVWFGLDIADEINADKPVYYGYCPEGTGCHAVTVVGYDDSDRTLFIYKNWNPVVTHKGFDEASDNRVIDITPAGRAAPPSNWSCAASSWEGQNGCHCGCGGSYDPDCDTPGATVLGCPNAGDSCNVKGACVSSCSDSCPQQGAKSCDAGKVVSCADHDADGCLEWGAAQSCSGSDVCQKGQCVPSCTDECSVFGATSCDSSSSIYECGQFDGDSCLDLTTKSCATNESCQDGRCVPAGCTDVCLVGARRCVDAAHVERCVSESGCAVWSAPQACPSGASCVQGDCVDGAPPQQDGGGHLLEHCGNNVDDDGDGLVDCRDPDCAGMLACAVPEICDNGRDDDGDGATDCADLDCADQPVCTQGGSGGCQVADGPAASSLGLLGLLLVALVRRRRRTRP